MFRFLNKNNIKQIGRGELDQKALDIINQNNIVLDRRIKQLEANLEAYKGIVDTQSETISFLQREIDTINKINNSTTEKKINAKYVKLGEASEDTMLLSSIFIDKADGLIKFKDKNGTVYSFDLT